MSLTLKASCDRCPQSHHFNTTPTPEALTATLARAERYGYKIADNGDVLCFSCARKQRLAEIAALTPKPNPLDFAAAELVTEADERDVIAKYGTPEQKEAYGIT